MKLMSLALAAAAVALAGAAQPGHAQSQGAWNGGPSRTDSWMGGHDHMGGAHRHGAQARVTLRRGDAVIDIRCPAGPQMQSCFDAAGDIVDRVLQAGPPPSHHRPPPPPPGGAGPNPPPPPGGPGPNGGQQGNSGQGNPPPPSRT